MAWMIGKENSPGVAKWMLAQAMINVCFIFLLIICQILGVFTAPFLFGYGNYIMVLIPSTVLYWITGNLQQTAYLYAHGQEVPFGIRFFFPPSTGGQNAMIVTIILVGVRFVSLAFPVLFFVPVALIFYTYPTFSCLTNNHSEIGVVGLFTLQARVVVKNLMYQVIMFLFRLVMVGFEIVTLGFGMILTRPVMNAFAVYYHALVFGELEDPGDDMVHATETANPLASV